MAFFLDEIDSDLWEYLRGTSKKIVLYGMGDGAEKIKAVLDEIGAPVADIMASDEFVRGHSFLGFRVKKLSEIIAEINSRTGKSFDEDVAATALLQIRDLLKKNQDLARSAKNNKIEDFKMVYDDKIDDALINGLDQNQDFYTMLLKQPHLKHELLDMFLSDVYQSYQTEVTK